MTAEGLESWGFNDAWAAQAALAKADPSRIGRILAERGAWWRVGLVDGMGLASAAGKLQRSIASSSTMRPAVGDWVVLKRDVLQGGRRLVDSVLPRRTALIRRAPGTDDGEQVLVANVDTVLIVTACGPDINPRRLERFVALAADGGARAVIVLNKSDLVDDVEAERTRLNEALPAATVLAVSAMSGAGVEALRPYVGKGQTVVLLGTSGAGKSTLLNRWLGRDTQATLSVRDDGKGRHTTTARETFLTVDGAFLIDTPGLREIGLIDAEAGRDAAFEDIAALAAACKFRDCQHDSEPGCAVARAVEEGTLPKDRFDAWHGLLGGAAGERVARRRKRDGLPTAKPKRR